VAARDAAWAAASEGSWLSSTVRPEELSATLRRLRRDAQLSGSEAARHGPVPAQDPPVGNRRQIPTTAEVEVLYRVYADDAVKLMSLEQLMSCSRPHGMIFPNCDFLQHDTAITTSDFSQWLDGQLGGAAVVADLLGR
jgi:hypothetical protein